MFQINFASKNFSLLTLQKSLHFQIILCPISTDFRERILWQPFFFLNEGFNTNSLFIGCTFKNWAPQRVSAQLNKLE